MNNMAQQEAMDRAGELPMERRVSERRDAAGRVATLEEALRRIARWHGEFPATGKFWPDGDSTSYLTEHGSDGERDYMRQVALDALAAPASQLDAPAPPEVAVEQNPVAWGLLHIQDPELTNDEELAAYWGRKGRKVTALYASPAVPVAIDQKLDTKLSTWLREFADNPGYSHGDYADVMRQAADELDRRAAPVAAGLPAIPEGQTRHFFRQLSSFGPYVECLRTDEGAVEFAPVLPVEVPSQPQDQSGSIRPSAEPAGQHDAMSAVLFDTLAVYAEVQKRAKCSSRTSAENVSDTLDAVVALLKADPSSTSGSAASGNTKPESSPIAEPDTATQAPSEGIDTQAFSHALIRWHLAEPGDDAKEEYDAIVAYVHSWHQRATQAAKPLTDEQIEAIAHRKCTSYEHVPKDLGIKYQFAPHHMIDFVRAIESHFRKGL